jgi:hypothetical protein
MRLATALVVCSLAGAASAAGQQAPSAEMEKAIEEFRVQTRTLGLRADSPAATRKNGRTGWPWHGRVFENFRNDVLDAVPHEIVQRGETKSLLRRNQFGFNIAGPVVIPKLYPGSRSTYFSLSYEGVRERVSRSQLRTIPTLSERDGDFSGTVDAAGSPLPIFDPMTTRPNPAFDASRPVSTDNLEYLRDPFPENRIPAHRIDPVAEKALGFYPGPNASVGPFFRNNYFIVSPETNTANGMIAKVDHSVGERHKVTIGASFSNGFLGAAPWFPTAANPGPPDNRFHSRRGSFEHTLTKSALTVNALSFEAASQTADTGAEGQEADYARQIGLIGASQTAFPLFQMSPYLSLGRSYPVSRSANNTYQWSEALSSRWNKHSLRAVARHVRWQVNAFYPQYPSGNFRFGEGMTSLPGIVNTGHAFASFLLGAAEFGENSVVTAPSYFRRNYWSFALRDQYEIRQGLNVSVGLNLEHNLPRTEKNDRMSTVDLNEVNPANGRPGALVVAGGRGERAGPLVPAHSNKAGTEREPGMESTGRRQDGRPAELRPQLLRHSDLRRPLGDAGVQRLADVHFAQRATAAGGDPRRGGASARASSPRSGAGGGQRYGGGPRRCQRPASHVPVRQRVGGARASVGGRDHAGGRVLGRKEPAGRTGLGAAERVAAGGAPIPGPPQRRILQPLAATVSAVQGF